VVERHFRDFIKVGKKIEVWIEMREKGGKCPGKRF
jgi:hypothetical protein